MEIVVGTIEVSGHDSDIVGAVLQVITLAHLQSGNLRNGIFLVGVFQRGGQQTVFPHGLGCVLRIDTGRTEEEQFLDTMGIRLTDDITLYLHIHHDEVGTVQ